MIRGTTALCALLVLSACRGYDYYSHLTDGAGLVPGDQLARYGREQAQSVAIARRFAAAHSGASVEDLRAQADTAVAYARTLPDVVNAVADPQSHRVTVQFRSGWIDGIVPLVDEKAATQTPNLPPAQAR
jgi:hypothetical protein